MTIYINEEDKKLFEQNGYNQQSVGDTVNHYRSIGLSDDEIQGKINQRLEGWRTPIQKQPIKTDYTYPNQDLTGISPEEFKKNVDSLYNIPQVPMPKRNNAGYSNSNGEFRENLPTFAENHPIISNAVNNIKKIPQSAYNAISNIGNITQNAQPQYQMNGDTPLLTGGVSKKSFLNDQRYWLKTKANKVGDALLRIASNMGNSNPYGNLQPVQNPVKTTVNKNGQKVIDYSKESPMELKIAGSRADYETLKDIRRNPDNYFKPAHTDEDYENIKTLLQNGNMSYEAAKNAWDKYNTENLMQKQKADNAARVLTEDAQRKIRNIEIGEKVLDAGLWGTIALNVLTGGGASIPTVGGKVVTNTLKNNIKKEMMSKLIAEGFVKKDAELLVAKAAEQGIVDKGVQLGLESYSKNLMLGELGGKVATNAALGGATGMIDVGLLGTGLNEYAKYLGVSETPTAEAAVNSAGAGALGGMALAGGATALSPIAAAIGKIPLYRTYEPLPNAVVKYTGKPYQSDMNYMFKPDTDFTMGEGSNLRYPNREPQDVQQDVQYNNAEQLKQIAPKTMEKVESNSEYRPRQYKKVNGKTVEVMEDGSYRELPNKYSKIAPKTVESIEQVKNAENLQANETVGQEGNTIKNIAPNIAADKAAKEEQKALKKKCYEVLAQASGKKASYIQMTLNSNAKTPAGKKKSEKLREALLQSADTVDQSTIAGFEGYFGDIGEGNSSIIERALQILDGKYEPSASKIENQYNEMGAEIENDINIARKKISEAGENAFGVYDTESEALINKYPKEDFTEELNKLVNIADDTVSKSLYNKGKGVENNERERSIDESVGNNREEISEYDSGSESGSNGTTPSESEMGMREESSSQVAIKGLEEESAKAVKKQQNEAELKEAKEKYSTTQDGKQNQMFNTEQFKDGQQMLFDTSDVSKEPEIKKSTYTMKSGKEKEIEYVEEIPEGYIEDKGATTAPKGYTWYHNNKSITSGERKRILVKDKAAEESSVVEKPIAEIWKERWNEVQNSDNYKIKDSDTADDILAKRGKLKDIIVKGHTVGGEQLDTEAETYLNKMERLDEQMFKEQNRRLKAEQSEPKEVKKSEPKKKEVKKKETNKLEDSGEFLKGNRKQDTSLTWDDLKEMNDLVRAKNTTKAKVYPKPTIEDLKAEGFSEFQAGVIQNVYNKINAKPAAGYDKIEHQKQYVDTINEVMSKVKDYIKSHPDEFTTDLIAEAAQKYRSWSYDYNKSLFDVIFPDTENKKASNRYSSIFRLYPEYNRKALIIGGNKFTGALQLDNKTLVDIKKAIEDSKKVNEKGEKVKTEPWEKTFIILEPDRWNKGYAVANKKGKQVFARYETKEEAIAAAKYVHGKIEQMNSQKANFVRNHIDRRENNRDVTTEELQNAFGFRGVNFGNWATAKERQNFANFAYDSLYDLAELLNLPPKAISLNGQLGLAYGAQGKGGFGRVGAAHYIPEYKEINLTKEHGAGSLAHEWWHALDNYFGNQATKKEYSREWALSLTKGGELRPELYEALENLQTQIKKAPFTEEDIKKRAEQLTIQTKARIKRYADSLKQDYAKSQNSAELHKIIDDLVENQEKYKTYSWEDLHEISNKFFKLVPSNRDTLTNRGKFGWLTGEITRLNDIEELSRKGANKSEYLENAEKIDGQGGGKYWSEDTELGARAFAAYIFDKMANQNIENRFLTRSGDGAVLNLNYFKELAEGEERESFTLSTTPKGEERARIFKAFDKLFNTIKTRETEKGVELYSLGGNPEYIGKNNDNTKLSDYWDFSKKPLEEVLEKTGIRQLSDDMLDTVSEYIMSHSLELDNTKIRDLLGQLRKSYSISTEGYKEGNTEKGAHTPYNVYINPYEVKTLSDFVRTVSHEQWHMVQTLIESELNKIPKENLTDAQKQYLKERKNGRNVNEKVQEYFDKNPFVKRIFVKHKHLLQVSEQRAKRYLRLIKKLRPLLYKEYNNFNNTVLKDYNDASTEKEANNVEDKIGEHYERRLELYQQNLQKSGNDERTFPSSRINSEGLRGSGGNGGSRLGKIGTGTHKEVRLSSIGRINKNTGDEIKQRGAINTLNKYNKEMADSVTDREYIVRGIEKVEKDIANMSEKEIEDILNSKEVSDIKSVALAHNIKDSIKNGEVPISKLNKWASEGTEIGQAMQSRKAIAPETLEEAVIKMHTYNTEKAPKAAKKLLKDADKIVNQIKKSNNEIEKEFDNWLKEQENTIKSKKEFSQEGDKLALLKAMEKYREKKALKDKKAQEKGEAKLAKQEAKKQKELEKEEKKAREELEKERQALIKAMEKYRSTKERQAAKELERAEERKRKAVEKLIEERTIGWNKKKKADLIDNIMKLDENGGLTEDNVCKLINKMFGIKEVTSADIEELKKLEANIKNAKTQREEDVAKGFMQKYILENSVGATWWDKIDSIRYINMLGSTKSRLLDFASTGVYQAVRLADNASVLVLDKALTKKIFGTDRVTSGFYPVEYAKGFVQGVKEGYYDVVHGINTGRAGETARYDLNRANAFKYKPLKPLKDFPKFKQGVENSFSVVEKFVSGMVRIPDRAFFNGRYNASLIDQLKARGMKLEKAAEYSGSQLSEYLTNVATQEEIEQAVNEARENVFQRECAASMAAAKIRSVANGIVPKSGDILFPFIHTTSVISQDVAERIGLGFVKGLKQIHNIRKNGGSTGQIRDAYNSIAKSITGAIIIMLGVGARLAGKDDDNDKTYSDIEVSGEHNNALNIGKTSLNAKDIPFLTIPYNLAKALSSGNEEIIYKGILKAFDDIAEVNPIASSYKESISQAYKYKKDSKKDVLTEFIANSLYTPTAQIGQNAMLKDVRGIVDPYQRETYEPNRPFKTAANRFKNSTPFISKSLPVKYNAIGEPVKKNDGNNLVERVVSGLITGYKHIKEDETYDIYNKTLNEAYKDTNFKGKNNILMQKIKHSIDVSGQKYKMSAEEFSDFQKDYGRINYALRKQLLNDAKNGLYSDENFVKEVNEIQNSAIEAVKIMQLKHIPERYKNGNYKTHKYTIDILQNYDELIKSNKN